jgi:RNA polymerase sigma factor (sigma-70 family)
MRLVHGRRDIIASEIRHDAEIRVMGKARWGTVLRRVHTLLDEGALAAVSDGELLGRYTGSDRESAEHAFAALVDRHGPMVLRVCRSVLRDEHAAHDAFQATFLVLSRRASSLWVHESIAPWLHQVAVRTSSSARSAAARRRFHERQAAERTRQDVGTADVDERGPILHREIDRLPERYRAAIVLCYLEGLTHEQAAERLSCPVGTVRSRLATGRERLRRRLIVRGMTPEQDVPEPMTSPEELAPAVPAALAESAIRISMVEAGATATGVVPAAVAALAAKELRIMMLGRLKTWTLGLLLVAGGGAIGVVAMAQRPEAPGEPRSPKSHATGGAPTPRAERRLLEARIETLREILKVKEALHQAGEAQVGDLPEWSRRLMEARLRLAGAPAERIVAIREHRDRMVTLQRHTVRLFQSGQATQNDTLVSKYYRLEADEFLADAGVELETDIEPSPTAPASAPPAARP